MSKIKTGHCPKCGEKMTEKIGYDQYVCPSKCGRCVEDHFHKTLCYQLVYPKEQYSDVKVAIFYAPDFEALYNEAVEENERLRRENNRQLDKILDLRTAIAKCEK